MWGKAPLIGFVENDLPPWRSGRDAAHGLTGGTVSWRVPFAGETPAAAGCLPSPRSAKPARTPCRPPGRRSGMCFALIHRQQRHRAGSGGQAVPTATSTVPPLSFSRSSCVANRRGKDALRGRLKLQITPRARTAAGWNRGQVEPFRLPTTIPLDPRFPRRQEGGYRFWQKPNPCATGLLENSIRPENRPFSQPPNSVRCPSKPSSIHLPANPESGINAIVGWSGGRSPGASMVWKVFAFGIGPL